MSTRGSFITEYIYCNDCFNSLRDWLLTNTDINLMPTNRNILAGFIGGRWYGHEIHIFDFDWRDGIEEIICHEVYIAVMGEHKDHQSILRFIPPGLRSDSSRPL